jgi:hypothetical protein
MQQRFVHSVDDNATPVSDFTANCGGTVLFERYGVIKFNPRFWPWQSISSSNNSELLHCLWTVRSAKNSNLKISYLANYLGPHDSISVTSIYQFLNVHNRNSTVIGELDAGSMNM